MPIVSSASSSATITPKPPPDPKTPNINPSSIDRAGLVGVGDLTTPRWTSRKDYNFKSPVWQSSELDVPEMDEDSEHLAQHGPTAADKVQDPEDNEVDRGSPWTIEAVDESDTNELSSYVSFASSSQNTHLTLNAL
jgi:dual specificity tyrosine-phosphorylation-regulated kinase 2/3/4